MEAKINNILNNIKNFFSRISNLLKPFIYKIKVILKNLFIFIYNIFAVFLRKIRDLFIKLGKWEKIVVIGLLSAIFVSSSVIATQGYFSQTKIISAKGGSYVEGIVLNNKSEIDQVVKKLTKIGLTYFDKNNNLAPALCDRWEISDDGKTYTFYLKNNIDSEKIAETVKAHKSEWGDISIDTPNKNIIKFSLEQPYSPFLAGTAEPLFDYGPYTLKTQDASELVFSSKDNFCLGAPYISEIVLKIYPDSENLNAALEQGKIMGVAQTDEKTISKKVNYFSMPLPRYQVVFFNLNREQFQNKEIRQKIKNNQKLDQEIKTNLVTSDSAENIKKAEELKNKWASIGLNVEVNYYDAITLQKDIIPNRNYDILLYGIDYGYDPDPYPFWHTSQMSPTGLNLSNFSNQQADAYLEDGRQTTNSDTRKEDYKKFQDILNDEVPAIFLNQVTWKYAISDKIKNITEHSGITPEDRFNQVWMWYIKEKRVSK
jgi:ABC-type transport system substrate-binding protein